eukprot:783756-Amorphochlora_amoeboformis.AAC.1
MGPPRDNRCRHGLSICIHAYVWPSVIPDPSVQRPDPLPDEKISERYPKTSESPKISEGSNIVENFHRKAENFQPAKGEAEEVD